MALVCKKRFNPPSVFMLYLRPGAFFMGKRKKKKKEGKGKGKEKKRMERDIIKSSSSM